LGETHIDERQLSKYYKQVHICWKAQTICDKWDNYLPYYYSIVLINKKSFVDETKLLLEKSSEMDEYEIKKHQSCLENFEQAMQIVMDLDLLRHKNSRGYNKYETQIQTELDKLKHHIDTLHNERTCKDFDDKNLKAIMDILHKNGG
jgi:hypothetical protein